MVKLVGGENFLKISKLRQAMTNRKVKTGYVGLWLGTRAGSAPKVKQTS